MTLNKESTNYGLTKLPGYLKKNKIKLTLD